MEIVLIAFVMLAMGAICAIIYGISWLLNQVMLKWEGGEEAVETGEEAVDAKSSALAEDVRSTCTILNALCRKGLVTEAEYTRLRDAIDMEYGYVSHLPTRLEADLDETTRQSMDSPVASDSQTAAMSASEEELLADVIDAELVADSPAQHDEPQQVTPPGPTTPAPWDIPDEPEPEPRRPLSELLAGFMQARNIRWGELASGILIVCSAVGLVVSLREQLSDSIPYFPALLFMLLTGAIHGAGIYTLKRWKLRNTSRGVLLIGLLLVPLNFLSACVLTGQADDQRPLTDPVYWIAMVTGLGAFTCMTWFSSKCLLRRGQLPLTLSILTCSVLLLVYNRLAIPWDSRWQMFLITLPPLGGFLMGVVYSIPQQWGQRRLSERATTRLFTLLGLSAFAFAAVAALLAVRAPDKLFCLLDLVPVFSVMCLVTAWLGLSVTQRREATPTFNYPLVGNTLAVLGLGLGAVALLLSIGASSTLLQTSSLCLVMLGVIATNRRLPQLLPAMWTCLGISALTALNIQLEVFAVGDSVSFSSLSRALISPSSAIGLMVVALCVVGGDYLLRRFFRGDAIQARIRWHNYASAGGALALGGVVALVASFVHPDDPFSVGTASALLLIVAFCGLGGAATGAHVSAPYVSGALLVLGWAHALIWNSQIRQFLGAWVEGVQAPFAWISVLSVLPLALAALGYRIYRRDAVASELLRAFAVTGGILLVACVVSGGFLLGVNSGGSSATLLVALAAAFVLAWSARVSETRVFLSLVSLSAVMVVLADMALRQQWCDGLWTSKLGWLELIAVAGWCLAGTTAAAYLRRWRWGKWLFESSLRMDVGVRYALASALVLMVVISMVHLTSAEISSKVAAHPDTVVQLRLYLPYVIGACVAVLAALTWESLFRPHVVLTGCLVALWFSVTALFALPFEDARATGSALRWLLPAGGVVLALIVVTRKWWLPAVQGVRTKLSFAKTPEFPRNAWQRLIDFSLAIPVIVTLVISSLITIQFLLFGKGALGGPLAGTLLGDLKKDISFGIPVGMLLGTCLLYAVVEGRSRLAVVGSAVLQYMVGLSIVLLFLSPNPQLATERFVNILQAVSLGMTLYGLVWYRFNQRIGPSRVTRYATLSQLDLHGAVNVLLVVSLGALILQRIFLFPDMPVGWVNAASGPLGVAALGLLLVWVWLVWPQRVLRSGAWFCGLTGLVVTAFLASQVDRQWAAAGWWPYRIVALGGIATLLAQLVWSAVWQRKRPPGEAPHRVLLTGVPMFFVGAFTFWVAAGGVWSTGGRLATDLGWVWVHYGVSLAVMVVAVGYGVAFCSSWSALIAAAGSLANAMLFVYAWDPWSRSLDMGEGDLLQIGMIYLLVLSLVWLGSYLFQRRRHRADYRRGFLWLPNTVTVVSCGWCLFTVLIEWGERTGTGGGADLLRLSSGMGFVMFLLTGLLCLLQRANERARMLVWCRYTWFASLAILIAIAGVPLVGTEAMRPPGAWDWVLRVQPLVVGLMLSVMAAGWTQWYRCRGFVNLVSKRLHLPRRAMMQRKLALQIPILHCVTTLVVVALVLPAMFLEDERSLRYLSGVSLFPLAFAFGGFAGKRRQLLQWCSLAMVTVALILLAWADLRPSTLAPRWVARMLIVACGTVFVYGVVMPRWLSSESVWLETVRGMTAAMCALAAGSLMLLLGAEYLQSSGGGAEVLPASTSGAVAVMLIVAMAGLVAIAVLPQHDPLSLALEQRMLYVYAAQVLGLAVAGHLYMTVPWLFRFGLEQYWPYLAMGGAFAGVGVANVLKQRGLLVLAKPIFHAAAVVPVVASLVMWPVSSEADASIVMLMAGGTYLLIGTTRSSLVGGAFAVVFANIALWLFYTRFDLLAFVDHPQLWLIPPALSVLVAVQWQRAKLTKQQLTGCRYICVVVIYVSSTAEIYISGIGDALWPPMVLALLSVAGILLGMLLHVRAYLYLGATFLLLSMITMVSHAQQRLEHVWPWWAFGIALGIAILVFFGVFEKKKNEMRALAQRLNEWDR